MKLLNSLIAILAILGSSTFLVVRAGQTTEASKTTSTQVEKKTKPTTKLRSRHIHPKVTLGKTSK